MFKMPVIENTTSIYNQLEKIEEEIQEFKDEIHPRFGAVDILGMQFEALDILASTFNLIHMLGIRREIYDLWVDKMNKKDYYTIKEWK